MYIYIKAETTEFFRGSAIVFWRWRTFFFLQNKIYKLAAQRLAFFCTLYTIIKNACAQYIKV